MESFIKAAKKRELVRPKAQTLSSANIKIIGTGGAGNNTIHRLMKIGIRGATCIGINTDKQHLDAIDSHQKILIGRNLTRGLGAGGNPSIGKAAAEESRKELTHALRDSDLVFIACGEGGGTGTGSAPVIAEIAKLEGAIVVSVVTLPFKSEKGRMAKALKGLNILRQYVDTLIVIDNNNLLEIAPDLPLLEAFSVADEVLATIVKGITETISLPSLINLDFADVRTILCAGGVTIVGVGESNSPENRVDEAINDALNSPLLDLDIQGAKGALIHVSGGPNMTLGEVNKVAEIISEKMDSKDALVIWGARIADDLEGYIRVMLLLTGIKSPQITGTGYTPRPAILDPKIPRSRPTLSDAMFKLNEVSTE